PRGREARTNSRCHSNQAAFGLAPQGAQPTETKRFRRSNPQRQTVKHSQAVGGAHSVGRAITRPAADFLIGSLHAHRPPGGRMPVRAQQVRHTPAKPTLQGTLVPAVAWVRYAARRNLDQATSLD